MIFVSMVIDARPGRAEELAAGMATMMRATVVEAGCIVYTYARDLEEPGRFQLTEIWENEPLMDAHIDADHAADFVRILNDCARIVSVKAFSGEAQRFRIRASRAR